MDLNLALKFSRDNFLKPVCNRGFGNLPIKRRKFDPVGANKSTPEQIHEVLSFAFASLIPSLLIDNLRDRPKQFLLGIVRRLRHGR